MHKRSCFWKSFRSERVNQFAILKQLSYCFEETIGFDVKASFASRPVSHLISWYNNQVIQQNNFDKKLFSSMGLFMDWKLQTVMALFFVFFFQAECFLCHDLKEYSSFNRYPYILLSSPINDLLQCPCLLMRYLFCAVSVRIARISYSKIAFITDTHNESLKGDKLCIIQ